MAHTSDTYTVKEIGRAHNDEMLNILSDNPIESAGLTICFDRKPDIFIKTGLKYDPVTYVGFFKEKELCGFASLGFYRAYVLGKLTKAFYFADGYVKRSDRRKGFFRRASELLFKAAYNQSVWGYAIVLRGNKNVESQISKQKKDYDYSPAFKLLGTLDVRNILITFRKKESKDFLIRKACIEDIENIVPMLRDEFSDRMFAPYIDRKVFIENLSKRPDFNIDNYYIAEKNGEIVGVCAAWDCRGFKQTRVLKYGRKFKLAKAIYAVLSNIFNFPPLPGKGEVFKDLYITDCAIKDRDPSILQALIRRIYNDHRKLKYNTLILGSYKSDSLLKAIKGFINLSVKSHMLVFSYDDELLKTVNEVSGKPYVDVAFL